MAACLALPGQLPSSPVFPDNTGQVQLSDQPVKSEKQPFAAPIPWTKWVDDSVAPKAVLLCIHGLSLHKGTYDAFGKRLAKDGYAVYAIDVRGFGDWQKDNAKAPIDLKRSLEDISGVLQSLRRTYPNLPIVILGESMGGAIALHATALYPDLVAGLISSVPAGDRYGAGGEEVKVGIHAILGGMNKEMNIGTGVVDRATKKEDLREAWGNDPLVRMKLSPHELLEFQSFMDANFEMAKQIKDKPVLFIQGMNDKLVRPAGTWKLCDSLTTSDHEIVMSKTAEHLIFEEGQFSNQDIGFVEKWVNGHILAGGDNVASQNNQGQSQTTTASSKDDTSAAEQKQDAVNKVAAAKPPTPIPDKYAGDASLATSQPPSQSTTTGGVSTTDVSYWIELYRDGKDYRCNNKYSFRSGDLIRFHMIPSKDGYAYIFMKQGTTGRQAVLFPDPNSGTSNSVSKGRDYPLPNKGWLKFDENPGVEQVSLLFSLKPLSNIGAPPQRYVTAFVSAEQSGAKDLVPARMRLSWDDPHPVILPQTQPQSPPGETDSSANKQASLVRVSCAADESILSVDIALSHN
jgi:alpha-beta hydrolase superfamily lysophospholipase